MVSRSNISTHPRREILSFQGFNQDSYCQISLYDLSPSVVIIAELAANQGTSAVNCIETVVSDIIQKHSLDPVKTIFVHHCPTGEGIEFGKEDFHRVNIQCDGKDFEKNTSEKWVKLTRTQVEQLINSPLQN
jgi:hypothetical protein